MVVAMLSMLAGPAALTLHTVHAPARLVLQPNPTPYGHTWSLLLFIIPIVVIAGWFLSSEGPDVPQRAFRRTIGILVPLGFLLDFVFAQWFFYYPNAEATLRIHAWALGHDVTVEEYIFYATGFIAVLLLYVWLGEYWLAAYNEIDYPGEARRLRRLLKFRPTSLILAVALIGAAWFCKKHCALPEDHAGFPGYFTVLAAGETGSGHELLSNCAALY
jgi:hypothetical protein